ncbi:MAG TPA: cytochrome c oxidase subunit II [Tepidisphaeraceae bacterium]|nr:cytochrome c oxidase subunit II [Tepidisphaeraceae bacterium]
MPATSGSFWMPPAASTVAGSVDGLFYFVFWITVIFLALVSALVIAFVIKYRYRADRPEAEDAPAHNTALELTWTVIPTVLVLMIFYFGFRGYLHMSVAPPDAYEINVDAKMWAWSFIYPNGHVDPELHVPVNRPVRLVLQSQDVIHSLYIPQFRIKRDAVPGRYNRTWFQATQQGVFDLYCAEYCGQGHSQMLTKVVVHDPQDFDRWLEDAANWERRMTPAEAGKMLFETRGCTQCHSVDGTARTGPTLKDLFGRQEKLADGSTTHVDENYIRESLYEPNARIVQGFAAVMPSYKATLKDRDVSAIIAYLKSISVHHSGGGNTANPSSTTQQEQ